MLCYFDRICDLDIMQLKSVYEESICKLADEFWLQNDQKHLEAEQQFYADLCEFYSINGARAAVWKENSMYISALRIERYKDGFLISSLETLPSVRSHGYASKLLKAVVETVGESKVYSHIHKDNIASMKLHKSLGFEIIADTAILVDGSVLPGMQTYCYVEK